MRIPIVFIVVTPFLFGCMMPLNLPMTSTLNDLVSMGTKTNGKENISFEYKSNILDGVIKPFGKDRSEEQAMHPGFGHSESVTLGRMLKEYMHNKFSKISQDGETKITILLKDFWIEQYSTESKDKQSMVALFGGEINIISIAKVKVQFTINRRGKEEIKVVTATTEDVFVSGIGTGTTTSFAHRGNDSIEYVHARNINKANNKVIMIFNSYLEEKGL